MKLLDRRLVITTLMVVIIFSINAFANKSSAEIETSEKAKKGTTIIIKVQVTHQGNNIFHHTNWVYVKANGKEIARWNFSAFNKPENEKFSREVSLKITGPVEIQAEANCNLHGSNGITTKKIIAY